MVVRKYLEELKGTPADEVRGEEEEKLVTKGLACPEASSLGCAVKTEVVPEDRPGHPWCWVLLLVVAPPALGGEASGVPEACTWELVAGPHQGL